MTVGATWLLYLSGLFILWTPLPLLYLAGRHGRRTFLLSAAVAFVVIYLVYAYLAPLLQSSGAGQSPFLRLPGSGLSEYFGAPVAQGMALTYFLYYLTIAGLLGESSQRQLSATRGFLLVVSGAVLVAGVGTWFSMQAEGLALIPSLRGYLEHLLGRIAELGGQAGLSGQEILLLEERRDLIVSQLLRMVPAGLILATLFTSWANLVVVRWLFPGVALFKHLGNLTRWRADERLIWCGIAAGVAFFLDYYLVKQVWLASIALNVLWVGAAIYFLQGLAIISYALQRRVGPILKALIYGLIILFFQVFAIVIMAIGVFDIWFDFRKITRKSSAG